MRKWTGTYANLDFSNSWTTKIFGADKTRAYANSDDGTGPGDVAYLYGSTARDTFNARKNDTYLGGVGFNNQATGFDAVHGDVLSGDDRAYFHDWTGDDTFWSRGGTARLHERPWIYGGR